MGSSEGSAWPRATLVLAGQGRCAPTAGHGAPRPALESCPHHKVYDSAEFYADEARGV